jgi:hypothetical protein
MKTQKVNTGVAVRSVKLAAGWGVGGERDVATALLPGKNGRLGGPQNWVWT